MLTDVGEAAALTTNLDGGPLDGRNRVVVRESDWPAIVGPETLALTTVLYDCARRLGHDVYVPPKKSAPRAAVERVLGGYLRRKLTVPAA